MHQVMQQISELRSGEKAQMMDMNRIESCKASKVKLIAKLKMELSRQKEILYNMVINKILNVK